MKNRVLLLLLSVSVWVPLAAIGAQAQYSVKIMRVDVPFEFNVGNQQYPAGGYIVRREGAFLSLRDSKGRPLRMLMANATMSQTAAPVSKLVFFQQNGVHLLTQILWEGEKAGHELVGKGKEAEVARRVAPQRVERAEAGSRP